MLSKRKSQKRQITKVYEKNRHGFFDFKHLPSFAKNYLRTFYSEEPTQDEIEVIKFLTRYYPLIKGFKDMIEIGCGPTLHHILPLNGFVSEIHLADYLDENLHEIDLWRKKNPIAHNWNKFTELSLRMEGRDFRKRSISLRENLIRKKIKKIGKCDLKKDRVLTWRRTYEAVGCFYCTEEVGINTLKWEKVMKRLSLLVKPGGFLFMAALRETDFYCVLSEDGYYHKLPCAYLTETDFRRVLPKLGFDMSHTIIKTAKIKGQEAEGVTSVILIAAKKQIRS